MVGDTAMERIEGRMSDGSPARSTPRVAILTALPLLAAPATCRVRTRTRCGCPLPSCQHARWPCGAGRALSPRVARRTRHIGETRSQALAEPRSQPERPTRTPTSSRAHRPRSRASTIGGASQRGAATNRRASIHERRSLLSGARLSGARQLPRSVRVAHGPVRAIERSTLHCLDHSVHSGGLVMPRTLLLLDFRGRSLDNDCPSLLSRLPYRDHRDRRQQSLERRRPDPPLVFP